MHLRKIELTSTQYQELKNGYEKGKSSAYRKRCHIVLLKSEGRTSLDVGQIVGTHQISVNNWLTRYELEGILGLKTKPGRGRKRIFDKEKDAEKVKAQVKKERQRLILKMREAQKQGQDTQKVKHLKPKMYHCNSFEDEAGF